MKQFLKPVYYVPAIIIGIIIIWSLGRTVVSEEVQVKVPVRHGTFVAHVMSTGQLQAENSTSIEVPSALSGRRLRIYEIQVTDIVEEGTVVDSGDFVASLDHSTVEEVLTSARTELEAAMEAYEDAKIDTNINLSNLRDGLLNGKVTVEEKELVVEQSIYESPAVQRQAKLDLERTKRDLEQSERNYELKKQQAVYDVNRAWSEVKEQRERVKEIENLIEALDVKAPKPGMVIYSFDRFGNKIQAGSTVSRWAPVIAELPDLSSMVSKTYINEIDVSKINKGQRTKIGIDAFPEKSFPGEVISVANIGQVLPEGDAKVFEVMVRLNSTDPELRPAMTTSNTITTDSIPDVSYIPLEALFSNDSARFVYMDDGQWVKQFIETGAQNANYVVVEQGLSEGQEISLIEPAGAEELTYRGHDIYEDVKERAREAEEEKQKIKEEQERRPRREGERPGRGNGNKASRGGE